MIDLPTIDTLTKDTLQCTACLSSLPLAYAYVPYQTYETPLSQEEALSCGTIFPQLNKPYGVYGNEFPIKEDSK